MPESSLRPNSTWQYATKGVAMLEMVLSLFQIAYSIFAYVHALRKSGHSYDHPILINDDNSTLNNTWQNDSLSEHDILETASSLESIWMFVYGVFCLVIAVILYWGAVRRDLKKCKIWMVVSIVLLLVEIADVIVVVITNPSISLLVDCVVMSIDLLCMWVVYVFMQETRGVNSRSVIVNPKPRV